MPSATGRAAVVNAMSIDVEDYFHVSAFDRVVPREDWDRLDSRVVRNTERLLDLFAEFGIRSTFFVLAWVGERHRDLVARIAAAGHEVASHGYAHRLIYNQTPAEFRDDIRRAKHVLEDACGRLVAGYRAPSFSVTTRSLWALDVLAEEGYAYDSSIFPVRHDRYGIPDATREPHVVTRGDRTLVEVPASTTRIGSINLPVAGGGYFRLLPYAWTRWGMRRVNEIEGRPAVFYLHPWELDPGQPRFPVGRVTRFRHYHNLDRTEGRLRQLMTDFAFDTVGRLVADTRARHIPSAMAPAAASVA